MLKKDSENILYLYRRNRLQSANTNIAPECSENGTTNANGKLFVRKRSNTNGNDEAAKHQRTGDASCAIEAQAAVVTVTASNLLSY